MSSHGSQRTSPARRWGLPSRGALLVAVSLATGLAFVPGVASAAPAASTAGTTPGRLATAAVEGVRWNIPETSCAPLGDVQWRRFFSTAHLGYKYRIVTATPVFYVSDSRIVDNGLDTPITATFSAQLSRTTTVQTSLTFSTAQPLVDVLNVQVSATIIMTRTTTIGVSTTATVQPHSRVLGEYGVHGYDVTYDAQLVGFDSATGKCYDGGTTRAFTPAPTFVEGWRVSAAGLRVVLHR